jgi:hypothetical protein
MTTAPRAGLPEGEAPYIARSLASLAAAGFRGPIRVHAEPGCEVPAAPGLEPDVVVHPETLGCYKNWRSVLEWYHADPGGPPWLLAVQDDVLYRDDAATAVVAATAMFDPAATGFASPYCSPAMVDDATREVAYARALGRWLDARFYENAFWGALALLIPRPTAAKLLSMPRFLDHEHHRKVDVLVGNCCRDLGLRTYVHAPSLCDHAGAISTLGRHKVRGIQWGRRGLAWRPRA